MQADGCSRAFTHGYSRPVEVCSTASATERGEGVFPSPASRSPFKFVDTGCGMTGCEQFYSFSSSVSFITHGCGMTVCEAAGP